ncbi:MAG TPA: hypothetical protein VIY73_10375 [Polyangiaceae bacterium]
MTRARPTFVRFCGEVLRLDLSAPWRVLLAVCVDGVQPRELDEEQREIARVLFGDVDEIDPRIRRILVWRLGRASGKSTIAAALAIYSAWTCDLSAVGRGQVPCAFVVSPSKPIAKIAVTIARELARGTDLDRFVDDDTNDGFTLRRPDGRLVEIRCVAASKGGANLRGRDVIVLVLDESEFFESNDGDGGVDGYAVTDRDQIAAVMPRLIEYVIPISTPWPTDNATAEYFDRNWGRPTDAVAAVGPSMFMRPSERLRLDIEREMVRDEENARREYDCVPGTRGGSRLFDADSVRAAIVEDRPLVISAGAGALVGAGGDVAFERDSSAIAVAARDSEGVVDLLEFDEVRPSRDAPLTPAYVVRSRFAPVMRRHGVRVLWADAFYRQSVVEHLAAVGLSMADAPAGQQGKYDAYMLTREFLRSRRLRIPSAPKLIAQLRAVTSTPLPGGKTKITSPRRAGSGHGDIVSAVVLACWALRDGAHRAAAQAAYERKLVRVTAAMALHGYAEGPPAFEFLPRGQRDAALARMAAGETLEQATETFAQRRARLIEAHGGREAVARRERLDWNLYLYRNGSSALTPGDVAELKEAGLVK